MATRQGKEDTEETLKKIIPVNVQVDLSPLSFGQAFMDSIWHFGYGHDMVGCWPTPNCARLLKVFAHGEVKVICFPFRLWMCISRARAWMILRSRSCDWTLQRLLRLSKCPLGSPRSSRQEMRCTCQPGGWCVSSLQVALSFKGSGGRGSRRAARALSNMTR